MQKFVKIVVTEPNVSKVPFMRHDTSNFEMLMAGFSFKVGEKLFSKEQATHKIQKQTLLSGAFIHGHTLL